MNALRRAQRARFRARVERIYWRDPRAYRWTDTRKPCSCPMCGNPRKWWKGMDRLTMQERRALLYVEDLKLGDDSER